jgi:hypothetical protein
MGFGEQMFTKASQNSDISASCSENIVRVAFYVNVKSCRYFINRLALITFIDKIRTYRTQTPYTFFGHKAFTAISYPGEGAKSQPTG